MIIVELKDGRIFTKDIDYSRAKDNLLKSIKENYLIEIEKGILVSPDKIVRIEEKNCFDAAMNVIYRHGLYSEYVEELL